MEGSTNVNSNKQRVNEALRSAKRDGLEVIGLIPPRDLAAALGPWARQRGMVPDEPDAPVLWSTPGITGEWRDFDGVRVLVTKQNSADDVRSDAVEFQDEALRTACAEAGAEGFEVVGAVAELDGPDRQVARSMQWIDQTPHGGRGWVRPRWMDGRNTTREWREYLGIKLLVSHARVSHSVENDDSGPVFELRPYQQQAIERLNALWSAGYRDLMLQSVTGSGKTEMFIASAMEWVADGGYVIVLAPKQELVRQTAKRVARAMRAMGLDGSLVGMQMHGEEPLPGQKIIVSTFNSAHKLPELGRLMVIIDEAHRSGSAMVVDALTALAPERLLGVTATPMRSGGKLLGDIYQFMVTALEYERGFEDGYLVRPRYLVPSQHDVDALREMKKQFREMAKSAAGRDDITDAAAENWLMEPGIIGGIVSHINQYASDRSGIAFTPTIKSASALADELRGAGYTAEMICAKTPKSERKVMLERFASGDTQWLVNVDVLTEGVDVPSCGAVVVARPTKSPVRWIQMAGRALRPAEGKGDCLIIDHTGCFLELGPVESYTGDDWTLEVGEGEAKPKSPREGKEVSLTERDHECGGCGNTWKAASPVCPVCGAIVTTRNFAKQNLVALRAELQEVCDMDAAKALCRTFRGQKITAVDVIGILNNKKLSADERQVVLKKVVPAGMREQIYRMLIHWSVTKRAPRPDHRAYMIYKSFFGTGTDKSWSRAGLVYSDELRPLIMEMVRINTAAYFARKNAGF